MAEALAFPPDRIRSAIVLRVLAAGLATGIGICIHGASKAGATTGQVVLMRAALSIPFLILWFWLTGPLSALRPSTPRAHLVRGLLGGTVMILNFYALGQLPVAHAQTISYLAPILAVPAAVVILGERLSVKAVLAVSLGFAGMIAMLYTTAANPDWGAAELSGMLAGLASAALMAVLRVWIRRMTLTETTASIALTFAVIASGVGLAATLVTGWTAMTPTLWAWLGAAAVFGAATHIAATEAARRAPIGVLAAYDYSGLVFAVALDFLLFASLPGPWAWLGIALIVGAGGLSAWTPRPEGTFFRLK
ncbi:DMT family transporter [Jannaschia seohaensis]|uniref:EamA domain-containing membrane protein RarD n=1 Tax=Jannaschia seohaensis TaxID=475081 RepID=A0A2Y9C3J7_9RHOB|nr:DMT family transporter [Jannaschia seohaensis]PWJ21665.1 EamA domain-containing membrane protein RarD [Jannaschia seohaensis]SSA37943.1 EamA domain-containing membrane protein RarD [Jannaschia seohaensis]